MSSIMPHSSSNQPEAQAGNDLTPSLAIRVGIRSAQESEEARAEEAGFFLRHVFLRERRYADLGNLLPMLLCRASG